MIKCVEVVRKWVTLWNRPVLGSSLIFQTTISFWVPKRIKETSWLWVFWKPSKTKEPLVLGISKPLKEPWVFIKKTKILILSWFFLNWFMWRTSSLFLTCFSFGGFYGSKYPCGGSELNCFSLPFFFRSPILFHLSKPLQYKRMFPIFCSVHSRKS